MLSNHAPSEARGSEQARGPTISARLDDGPLQGIRIEAEVVEGRPPSTVDVPADDSSTCRYCLAERAQSGPSALYTFLYRVESSPSGCRSKSPLTNDTSSSSRPRPSTKPIRSRTLHARACLGQASSPGGLRRRARWAGPLSSR